MTTWIVHLSIKESNLQHGEDSVVEYKPCQTPSYHMPWKYENLKGFGQNTIIALAGNCEAAVVRMNECAIRVQRSLEEKNEWISRAEFKDLKLLTTNSSIPFKFDLFFSHIYMKKSFCFEFTVRELVESDRGLFNESFPIEEFEILSSKMGFATEFAALDRSAVEVREELCPLLFLQLREEEEWKSKFKEGLIQLSQKISIWASESTYYCKWDDSISSRDTYIGLSFELRAANLKTLKATRSHRGDCMDDIDEGSDTKPCALSLFPGAGQYILNASSTKLEKRDMSMFKMLEKCPVAEMTAIITQIGLVDELSAIKEADINAANLAPVIIQLVKGGLEGARAVLTNFYDRKRKALEPVDESGVADKIIKQVMKKVKGCTRRQAVESLRAEDLDPKDARHLRPSHEVSD